MSTDTTTTVVLDRFEHNGYDDSDFYAIVWDGEQVSIVETGSTRHAGTFHPGPPATREHDHAARQWIIGPLARAMRITAEQQARTPAVGATVRSTTTRGKNVGATGRVRRLTTATFRGRERRRALVALDSGEQRWMDADRIERTDAPPITEAQISDEATHAAWHRRWLDLIHLAGLRRGAWL